MTSRRRHSAAFADQLALFVDPSTEPSARPGPMMPRPLHPELVESQGRTDQRSRPDDLDRGADPLSVALARLVQDRWTLEAAGSQTGVAIQVDLSNMANVTVLPFAIRETRP